MKLKISMLMMAALTAMTSAHADSFVNGGFEDGNFGSWSQAGAYRGNVLNSGLTPAFVAGASPQYAHNSLITAGHVDPIVGAAFGSTVYAGNHSARVEDTVTGGYASILTQTVSSYTDADIYFAWKAVLQGAHGEDDAAVVKITLTDLTTGNVAISRTYNAASGGSGVDARWTQTGQYFYTADWQIEHLPIDSSLSGHTFALSVLAADCEPTGHRGYAYIDGFGAVTPPTGNVPEPASLALAGLALAGAAAARRRRVTKA